MRALLQTRMADISFPFSATNSFGPANSIIKTAPLDISNPTQTVVNTVAGATTAGPTTGPTVAATNRTTTSGSAALFQRVLIHGKGRPVAAAAGKRDATKLLMSCVFSLQL